MNAETMNAETEGAQMLKGKGGDAPVAEIRPSQVTVHGRTVEDDYAWLKAANWQAVLKDPAALPEDIAAYLRAENAYTDAALAGTADLRKRLVAEMRARIREDDSGVPEPDGPFAYYTRHRDGGQHPLVCRRPTRPEAPLGLPEEETILIDGDKEGTGCPSSRSPRPPIRTTTPASPGARTPRARNCTRSGCATSPRGRTDRT